MANKARLIRLRKELGFSQRDFAREFQVSCAAVALWEKGARAIPGPVMKLIEMYESCLYPSDWIVIKRSELDRLSTDWVEELLSSLSPRKKSKADKLRLTLTKVFSDYLQRHLSDGPVLRKVQIATFSRLIRQLGQFNGLPLKIIQLASHLDPDASMELRQCLSELQRINQGMPEGIAARVIHQEFGKHPRELFAQWEPKPIVAASIGQVHRARLHSGEQVAVKIQYPGIAEQFNSALDNAALRSLLSSLIKAGSDEIVDEFRLRLLEECDYRKEAESQERFHKYYESDPEIKVPRIFLEYSRDRVLTSEFIEGESYDSFKRNATQKRKDRAAEIILRFQADAVFDHKLIHADLHPGNLMFLQNAVAFIDFGRVVCSDAKEWDLLKDIFRAIIDDDKASAKRSVMELGIIQEGSEFAFDDFWQILREEHQHFWEDAPFEFSPSYLSRKSQLKAAFRQKNPIKMKSAPFWNLFLNSTQHALRADLRAKSNWRRLIKKSMRTLLTV